MAAVDSVRTVQATAKFVRISPRKARLVTDNIRGRSVPEARTILAFTERAAAIEVEKVLRSAVANAESNPELHWSGDDLVVAAVFVDEGPTLKRWRARARGRVARIRKRTCHITIQVAQDASAAAPAVVEKPSGRHAGRRPRRRVANGTEGSSRRSACRRHPRLEVELDGRQEGICRRADRGHQDSRAHPQEAVARGAVGHPDPQGQAADHDRHLHRAPRHRHRQVRCRGGRAAQRSARDDPEERAHQHQRDQAARARREARRAVDRGAAAEPRVVPAGHEALARVGHPLGCRGGQGAVLGPPRRLGDEPLGAVLRGPRAAAHDPRRHRLRLRRGEDPDRPHRRQGLDQQGRDHAGGLRRHSGRGQGDAPRRPGHRTSPRRRHRGPRRLARVRPQPQPGSRGSRPGASRTSRPARRTEPPRRRRRGQPAGRTAHPWRRIDPSAHAGRAAAAQQAPEPQVDTPTPGAAEAPPEATTPPPAEKPKAAPRKKKADS